ncbi:spermidine synthase [Agromyces archimandritae]|uniref:Fused MFS/spermidine synthase n=1 Tax=Agromyces archimandritae TaxID=2781962 RepID=A0A975IPD1_9MICO|nr:fused MFS/spermidine synthase [Agromyces archimandritae]QTX05513.1 fused MFS/spermidine synthase [Agromyces archimandritae]
MAGRHTRPGGPGDVTVTADPIDEGALELVIDGAVQSHVVPGRPERLFFEYTRRLGHVVDLMGPPGAPLNVLHLGGGGMSLPRYTAWARPGSTQTVVEAERRVVDAVAERMPLSPAEAAAIRIVVDDALGSLDGLGGELAGSVDLVIVDAYRGLEPAASVLDGTLFARLVPLLAGDGVVAVNVADEPGGHALQAEAAALRRLFPAVLAAAAPGFLDGRVEGNAVLVAGGSARLAGWATEFARRGPHPVEVREGAELGRDA